MSKVTNILLVDDVEYSRELLRSAVIASINDEKLPLRPHFFHEATTKKALELLNLKDIHLVYLDINLVNENGLELLKSIKEFSADISVVMVSGEGSSANVMSAIENGADGFIVKPFNTGRIVETLHKYLKKGHSK
ncbi:MAG: two-component system chemotaxis response regulator CheY [Glaciecola sp.]|jgi:two-component system chemotaxis response regulator CheY